jgi:hypothetical protein
LGFISSAYTVMLKAFKGTYMSDEIIIHKARVSHD